MTVSILTDSWESVQHCPTGGRICRPQCFNPHRLLGVGATSVGDEIHGACGVSILTDSWESVQRLRRERLLDRVDAVSILTDSWESVQPVLVGGIHPIPNTFQSSPTPGSRCNGNRQSHRYCADSFNPHRLLGVGATRQDDAVVCRAMGFNPHRLLGVGATG